MYDPTGTRLNKNFNCQLFVLAVLCSSLFMYNVVNVFDSQKIEELSFVSTLGDTLHIGNKVNEKEFNTEDTQRDHFAELFVFLVRDFCLQLKTETQTGDEYMEEKLALLPGSSTGVKARNALTGPIREHFPTRHCVLLPAPVNQEDLSKVNDFPFSSLKPGFQKQVQSLVRLITEKIAPKKIRDQNGHSKSSILKVNGSIYVSYLETLLEQLNTSERFCVEDAWTSLATKVSRDVFDSAIANFVKETSDAFPKASLPVSGKRMASFLTEARKHAIDFYLQSSLLREDEKIGTKAVSTELDKEANKLMAQNYNASEIKGKGLVDTCVKQLIDRVRSQEVKSNSDYEEQKMKLLALVRSEENVEKIGPAFAIMETHLNDRLSEGDKVAQLCFKLTSQEIEIQEQQAQQRKLVADQERLRSEMKAQQVLAERREQEWKITQAKAEEAHRRELQEAQEENAKKMCLLRKEHEELIANGQRDLADLKMRSQQDLQAAMTKMNADSDQKILQMRNEHADQIQQLKSETEQKLSEAGQKIKEYDEQLKSQSQQNNTGNTGGFFLAMDQCGRWWLLPVN
jgi:hypothetical protein